MLKNLDIRLAFTSYMRIKLHNGSKFRVKIYDPPMHYILTWSRSIIYTSAGCIRLAMPLRPPEILALGFASV